MGNSACIARPDGGKRTGARAKENAMDITPEQARLKMLRMRSWRRGMKEMDLILGPYADAHLDSLSAQELDAYDALLAENDQDLYLWVTGARTPPAEHEMLLTRIAKAGRTTRS
jgi:antitoxin CptB